MTQLDLSSVRTGLLDCIQANLAVLADHHHGPGAHLRFGAPLGLRFWPGPDGGPPTVDPPLTEQLATLPPLAGLRVVRHARLTPAELRAEAAGGGVRYVVADAYRLPWLPYHGRAHMPHSFLLSAGPGGWQITDAYRNETEWGPATPGHWVLPEEDLPGIGTAEVTELAPDTLPPPAALPPAADVDPAAVDSYLAAYDACPDRATAIRRLTVETWLLARTRKLHATYRALYAGRADGPEPGPEADHLRAWDKVVEQTYLAHRRVARGRAEPPGVLDRLRAVLTADRTVFGAVPEPAAPTAADDDALRRTVADVAADVLGVPAGALLGGAPFDSFPAFSSFRLVEIIERLESALDRELDADELIPENLRRVDDLCRIAR
ncbi:acyl carrier protein [Streptomyces sp. RS10V-4]|uniref:acyl carrier protein n=1 Tax=Streptomyces rhizoryzae TaxID=2932493 RepID=UPI00200411B8|nr:acyl carrier protein [Streptomyces rhizoryzae]MCK7622624.1 acyl carrier protein [Streptomyces rhizoryzae]